MISRKSLSRNYKYFVKSTYWIAGFFLLGILLFFFSRLAYLFSYADFKELSNFKVDIIRAFGIGFRFDSKVLTIGMLPLVLVSLATLPIVTGKQIGRAHV